MSAHRVPPSSSRRDERREALVDALIDLFLAEGFLAFGMGDLAARLRCSRSSLYLVASSKESIVLTAVRRYFRRAARRIEERVAAERDPGTRLSVYLAAVSEELAPASARFHEDLARYAPAGEVYEENTVLAARRVRELVAEGVASGALRPVHAAFVGAAVAQVMSAIQSGAIGRATGLADAAAYRALADLVVGGLGGRSAPAPAH
jgi:AcrR family transcriptional regulator